MQKNSLQGLPSYFIELANARCKGTNSGALWFEVETDEIRREDAGIKARDQWSTFRIIRIGHFPSLNDCLENSSDKIWIFLNRVFQGKVNGSRHMYTVARRANAVVPNTNSVKVVRFRRNVAGPNI